MGESYSMHGLTEIYSKFQPENLKGRDNL